MIKSKKQIQRLLRLIGELKENKYPNCSSFAGKLRNADIDENLNLSCTPKTIQRDIRLLKEEYNAPIDYDSERKGYYLKHHGWNFNAPVLDEEFLLSAILGAKTAESIIPEPIRSQIRSSIDNTLATNNPDFLDTALIDTFIVASGVKVSIDSNIFKTLFLAWQLRNSVKIKYVSHNEDISERMIDPYFLTFYNQAWYVKGYCGLKNDIRIFAIHRISDAELTDYTFETDQTTIKQFKVNHTPFEFEEVENVKIWCSKLISGYVIEQHKIYKQDVSENEDGSIVVIIPNDVKLDIIKWVLSEGGEARILEPQWLWDEVKKRAEKILQKE